MVCRWGHNKLNLFMKLLIYLITFVAFFLAGVDAQLITNGDWESTLNPNWSSSISNDTQADLNGWFSSLKDLGNLNGAYVEPITGYGNGMVGALKDVSGNYFQQTLMGVDAKIGEVVVNYDGGIRSHNSYSTTPRDVILRVSLWDITTNTELVGINTVTAYSSTVIPLEARSHVLTYDNTGLAGNTLAIRFENITDRNDNNESTVLFDNIEVWGEQEPSAPSIIRQPTDAIVTQGESHTFHVSASGSPPVSYQWRKNEINLSGKNLSELTLENIQFSDAGDYSVIATNSLGSTTSLVATLTVTTYDDDGDGLPSAWEIANGLDPNDDGSVDPNNGAAGDPDHDGLPNDEEFFMNSDPQLNESGKPWQSRPEKVQLMVVSAHPDDEGIFFGGLIPYYTQVRQLPTVCISLTSGDAGTRPPELREAEFRNAVWAYGLRNQPIFPRFKDYPRSYGMDRMWDIWYDGVDDGGTPEQIALGKEKVTRTLATYIRRYRPTVLVTHDFLGEYGHTNHKGTALGCEWAVTMAADPSEELDGLPAWQVKKFYVHMHGSGGNPAPSTGAKKLFHDFWQEVSIDTTGNGTPDKTPIQVANTGLDFHASQGRPDVSTCYANGETSSSWQPYPCEWWELHATTVAADTIQPDFTYPNANHVSITYSGWAKGDLFEHLTTFPDSDYDQLADAWELDHFSTLSAADPQGDDDEDGRTNLDEFIAGLDPKTKDTLNLSINPADSVVAFDVPAATGAGYDGLTRRYQLKHSVDLDVWSTVAEGVALGIRVEYAIPAGSALGFYHLAITLE